MSLEWYPEQLKDHSTYKEHYYCVGRRTVIGSIVQRLDKKYLDLLDRVVRQSKLFTTQRIKFLEKVNARGFCTLPKFHLIPKIHKEVPTTPPIVPTFNWDTTNLSKVLSVHLNGKVKTYGWTVKDTTQLLKALEEIGFWDTRYDCKRPSATVREDRRDFDNRTQHSYRIITGDVTRLYINVPAEEGCRALTEIYDNAMDDTINATNVGVLMWVY